MDLTVTVDHDNVVWYGTERLSFWSYRHGNSTDVEQCESKPVELDVRCFPNPFNPSTTIGYTLSAARDVILAVYSVTGQKVATLVDGFMQAGRHRAVFDGTGLASGVYFYRLAAAGAVRTGKMVLVR